MTAHKKAPTPSDLARAIVNDRLVPPDDHELFLDPSGCGVEGEDWFALLDAIAAGYGSGETYSVAYDRVNNILDNLDLKADEADRQHLTGSLLTISYATAQAGFLLGLALGRRLGGAR